MKKWGEDLLLWILCVCITGTLCLIEAGISMLRYDAEALTQDDGKLWQNATLIDSSPTIP
ncbi:MAG: hypothetical protein Q4C65_10200 [Eubacteriales bacterium]|nr:hypothetical protein [Eubacteriales bacterium]